MSRRLEESRRAPARRRAAIGIALARATTAIQHDPLRAGRAARGQEHEVPQDAAPAAEGRLRVCRGFRVERLYPVPSDEQGSWVNLTPDHRGRLIVSDQFGKLYRV